MSWNFRVLAGSVTAFCYNAVLSGFPSRTVRRVYLRIWLGALGPCSGVQRGCKFLNGRKVHVGRRVVVNFGCLLDGRVYPIHIGDDVSIGPEASILTLGHDPQSPEFANDGGEVRIGDHAWIAYKAIILPGVEIGEGAIVAAGSVVTRDVAAYTIVAGSPAKVVGTRQRPMEYRLDYRPWLM